MIDEAKRKAASANGTAGNTLERLDAIRKEIDKISVTPVDSNLSSILDDVDQSGEILNLSFFFNFFTFMVQNNQFYYNAFSPSCLLLAVKNLLKTIPSLNDKISEVENLTSQFSPISNITENIKKIKELIEQARDAANRVRSHSVNTSIQ